MDGGREKRKNGFGPAIGCRRIGWKAGGMTRKEKQGCVFERERVWEVDRQ